MTRYIDPNSGAAPQPGGYAGPEAAKRGFAQAGEAEQEVKLHEYADAMQPDQQAEPKSVQQIADEAGKQEPTEEQVRAQAAANPLQTLAEEDEGNSASSAVDGDTPSEEEASDAKALETEAVNLNEEPKGDSEEDKADDKAEKKTAAKKSASSKKKD